MINKTKKEIEIECLDKLLMGYGYYADLINFLMEDKLMTPADATALKKEGSNITKFLYDLLKRLQSDEKLMLLHFEWEMLPEERIRLTLVSNNRSKEFKHNY
jgi:hypothetical protein